MAIAPNSLADRPAAELGRLVRLRWWMLAGEIAAILAAPALLDLALPRWPMLAVVGVQVLANAVAAYRQARRAEVETGLFAQLMVDLVAFAVLMFLSGGAANPLISLLLPPVAIAALALPAGRVAVVAATAIGAYSLLMVLYLPLPIADAARAARLHLAGMWITFVISVGMGAWLLVRMTDSIRRRDADLAAARERAARDEGVVALGAQAAGAAHELGTPLATIAVIAGEIGHDAGLSPATREDLAVLRRQVAICKEIISQLAERAGAGRLHSAQAEPADQWLQRLFSRWQEQRPQAVARLTLAGMSPPPSIVAEPAVEQGITNLFNNAADAGRNVSVAGKWEGGQLAVEVRDDGPGFAAEVLARAGRAPFPPRPGGGGIGLFLACAAIRRLGGELELRNDGGGVARVSLPLGRDLVQTTDAKEAGHASRRLNENTLQEP